MKKYAAIADNGGNRIATSTLDGLRTRVRNGLLQPGNYTATTPCGNTHRIVATLKPAKAKCKPVCNLQITVVSATTPKRTVSSRQSRRNRIEHVRNAESALQNVFIRLKAAQRWLNVHPIEEWEEFNRLTAIAKSADWGYVHPANFRFDCGELWYMVNDRYPKKDIETATTKAAKIVAETVGIRP